ncbi:MAG: 50S ribosomal protein L11 methyltransferase [Bacteroidetes bacterium SW_9_63_38]|nr:MAG: 50S ribosomal protein L11 methyltransferase [Bacteroidetes bacterium SW_9_63_38]
MDTVELTLSVPALGHDRYIGLLDDRATGFRQTDAVLVAYVPVDDWSADAREALAARLRNDGYGDALSLRLLAPRNWNAEWESAVSPVRVGPFLLCGTDANVPPEHDDATVLRIDPAQSFGTGHHATTRLCLQLIGATVASGDTVVDVGTGTGVLAIAACRHGARSALGVDTDVRAVENARAHVRHNGVSDRVAIRKGSVEAVPSDVAADVIAVNITMRPLRSMLPALRSRLAPDGTLLLSGLLTSQRSAMRTALDNHNLIPDTETTEDGWWAVHCRPRT